MERIYIEEDDAAVRGELIKLLQNNGYRVVDAPPCELALLDVNLGGKNGFEICRELRKVTSAPVIFLTARESVEDELIGFGVGADDYIRKPYDSSVLLARIGKLLRRSENPVTEKRGLMLLPDLLCAEFRGQRAQLTRNEARILNVLMKKEVCTKDEIIAYLWDNSLYIDENTLYVNLSRLREKLKSIGAEGFLTNVRNVGYKL